MAIASLVIGLLSLAVGFCCGLCGSPFPIIGLILGIVAISQTHDRGLAIAGIVLNVIGIVVIVAMLAVNSYFFMGGQPSPGGVRNFQNFQDFFPQPLDATDPPSHDPGTVPGADTPSDGTTTGDTATSDTTPNDDGSADDTDLAPTDDRPAEAPPPATR